MVYPPPRAMAAKVSNEKIVNKMEGLGKKAASKALTLAANKKLGHGKAQASWKSDGFDRDILRMAPSGDI